VLVLVALATLVILGAFGLSTDIAVFYYNWAQLTKEADAAALAGANYLPDNPSKATATATTWVSTNGQAGDRILKNTTGSQGYNGQAYSSITVQVQRTVPYYFGKVFGLTSAPIKVSATAGVEPINSAGGYVPIAMPCTGASCYNGGACTSNGDGTGCYSCGKQVTVDVNSANMTCPDASNLACVPFSDGDWFTLACPAINPGDSGFLTAIQSGCPTFATVSQNIQALTKPGNDTLKKTVNAINNRICGSSSCSSSPPPSGVCSAGGSTLDPSDPHVALLPLVDTRLLSSSRSSAPVQGFTEAWIMSASGHTVTIEFVTGSADVSAKPNPNGPNTGSFYTVLLQ
jgi:hypothetical protein